jgi:selenide,water dikinase
MRSLPGTAHPDLLVGYDSGDDAGIYRLGDDLALVQTLDFITPIVDDPRTFGMIAAANSLSDVYAMGGRPLTAMNILCYPAGCLPEEAVREILEGGLEKINEAGAVLAGGHSVNDPELKYGLSVTGLVHPGKLVANKGALPGDLIILTKPLGTGVVATAVKAEMASPKAAGALAAAASSLNRIASEVMLEHGVHACTDVTGFGLGGHLMEMARAGGIEATLRIGDLPLIEGAGQYAAMGLVPAGAQDNRKFFSGDVEVAEDIDAGLVDLVFDPQTSGGLLMALGPGSADACLDDLRRRGLQESGIIGEVTGGHSRGRISLVR